MTASPAPPRCHKIRYRDKLGALIELSKASRKARDEIRAYRCPSCGGWHLTSRRDGKPA